MRLWKNGYKLVRAAGAALTGALAAQFDVSPAVAAPDAREAAGAVYVLSFHRPHRVVAVRIDPDGCSARQVVSPAGVEDRLAVLEEVRERHVGVGDVDCPAARHGFGTDGLVEVQLSDAEEFTPASEVYLRCWVELHQAHHEGLQLIDREQSVVGRDPDVDGLQPVPVGVRQLQARLRFEHDDVTVRTKSFADGGQLALNRFTSIGCRGS